MASMDIVERKKKCPCNNGEVIITEYSPDHPFAKESQTGYECIIKCQSCNKKYIIDDIVIEGVRYIVLKSNDKNGNIIKYEKIDLFCKGLFIR